MPQLRPTLGILAALALPLCAVPAAAQQYDVIIRHGRVVDGTGNPWYYADVAVSGDRIAAVGDLSRATAKREVDATGLYVAPGFIDVHSHSGPGLATKALSPARPLVAQGITTVFVNPDGGGPVDLAAQRAALLRDGLGVNVAQLMPHGSVRQAVLGMADRAPTPAELERMKGLVRKGMDLAFAVRSMTSLPATVFGVADRGQLRPGAFADVVVFDLAKVRDKADYQNPHQLAEGMVDVLVNGRFAVDGGRYTDEAGGRVLQRRPPRT